MINQRLKKDLHLLLPPKSSHLQKFWVNFLNSWPTMFRLLTPKTIWFSYRVALRTMYSQLIKSKNWEILSVVNSLLELNLEMQYFQEVLVIIIVVPKSHLTDLLLVIKGILLKCKALRHHLENQRQLRNRSSYRMVLYLWIRMKFYG